MTQTVSRTYGSPSTVTFTQASLATSSGLTVGRESNKVDNTTEKATDYEVEHIVKTGTTLTAGSIELWCACSVDGTVFDCAATGADAGLTPVPKTNMKLVWVHATTSTNSISYKVVIPSLAAILGAIPNYFNFFITQNSNANLDATGGNHSLKVTPVHETSA